MGRHGRQFSMEMQFTQASDDPVQGRAEQARLVPVGGAAGDVQLLQDQLDVLALSAADAEVHALAGWLVIRQHHVVFAARGTQHHKPAAGNAG